MSDLLGARQANLKPNRSAHVPLYGVGNEVEALVADGRPETEGSVCDNGHSSGKAVCGPVRFLRYVNGWIGSRQFVWCSVLLLLAIHAWLLAYAATQHSPTMLEPGFLAAGISHWEFGRFELFRVNPPLVRMVAALPVLAVGYEADWSRFLDAPGSRSEFPVGSDFIKANGERSLWLFTIARWACIPFSLIGGVFCFLWAQELWSRNAAGLIALTLWCFEPNVLAHGELITTDCAAASLGLGAGYFFWRWLKQPSWSRVFLAGLFLGLAELTKTTWIVLFVLWPVLWMVWRWRFSRDSRVQRQEQETLGSRQEGVRTATSAHAMPGFCQLAVILFFGVYLINVAYGLEGTFTRLRDFTFVSETLAGLKSPQESGNRFTESWLGALPVPLPKQYVLGIDTEKRDLERPHRNYLAGEWKEGGWWYYYLYGLWVKVPHGTQLVVLLAAALFLARQIGDWLRRSAEDNERGSESDRVRREARDQRSPVPQLSALNPQLSLDFLVLLLPALVLFVLVSSQTNLNQHFRYVLPCFGFGFAFAGGACFLLESTSFLRRLLPVGCLLWAVSASVVNHPHHLAYFNELSGGPRNGQKHLLHSSFDWGQDLIYLKQWCEENPYQPRPLIFLGQQNSACLCIKHRTRTDALIEFASQRRLLPGTYVINATALFDVHQDGPMEDICDLLRMQANAQWVGASLCIFPIGRPVEMKR